MFRRKILPPSSVRDQQKLTITPAPVSLLRGLLLDPEDGSAIFLRNFVRSRRITHNSVANVSLQGSGTQNRRKWLTQIQSRTVRETGCPRFRSDIGNFYTNIGLFCRASANARVNKQPVNNRACCLLASFVRSINCRNGSGSFSVGEVSWHVIVKKFLQQSHVSVVYSYLRHIQFQYHTILWRVCRL
jgi:hypothetical protein